MDGPRFDALARAFGSGTRRSVLHLTAGTSIGALLLERLGIEDASAGCVAPGKKCKKRNGKKKKCCGGAKCRGKKCKCTNGGVGCGAVCCEPAQVCQAGQCACANGGVLCGGVCCVPGQVCQAGQCANGSITIGDACNAAQPGACTSGVCGCTCNGQTCICRNAACLAPAADCDAVGTVGCCEGFCIGGNPNTCQIC
jgi:hypothetical protein